MSLDVNIETIVKLVAANQCEQAVSLWKCAQAENQACTPCFYSPIHESIRCAECLDTHIANAQLRRSFSHIDENIISQTKHDLQVWSKQTAPSRRYIVPPGLSRWYSLSFFEM